jgi:predicted nicotinamide N-methyase
VKAGRPPAFFYALLLLFFPSLLHMLFSLHLQTMELAGTPVAIFVPELDAVKAMYEEGAIHFPYWSQVWPAAKALAQFLLLNPSYTNGKSVLEIGAGLGLPSLVAARNAARVLCTDHVPEAVAVARQSAEHNRLQNFTADVLDWQHLPKGLKADVLLLSDINYEPAAFDTLQKVIAAFLQGGTTIVLSTPQRLMARTFIAPLLANCTRQEEIVVLQKESEVPITVLVLVK